MKHPLPLIGVIDLRGGRAVHAIAGQRDHYRDVVATDVEPGDAIGLANRYRRLGVNSLYVADLDAICGLKPNTAMLSRLSTMSNEIFVDAGPCCVDLPHVLLDCKNFRFIIPTESFCNIDDWEQACTQIGIKRVTLGLDIVGNRLRTEANVPAAIAPSDHLFENIAPWIDRAVGLGIDSLVVLDLAFVGTGEGAGIAPTCRIIADSWPDLHIISGGGVRNPKDVQTFLDAGCERVLVATALHQDDSLALCRPIKLIPPASRE